MNEGIKDLLNSYKKKIEPLDEVSNILLRLVEPPYEVNSGEDFDNELKELMKRYEIDINGDKA